MTEQQKNILAPQGNTNAPHHPLTKVSQKNTGGAAAQDQMHGTLVCGGRYMITKSIGKGSFGEIFQGVDTQSRKEVAIKMVSENFD